MDKYTYYDKRGGKGPYETANNGGIVGEYGAYPTVEAMLQSTHPNYCNIRVNCYDVVQQSMFATNSIVTLESTNILTSIK